MNRPEFIEVDAGVRYWEDATVNELEDVDGTLVPFRSGDRWRPVIRLDDGQVMNWPEGMTARIHYKVCDDGNYWLQDAHGNRIAQRLCEYVPDKFLCHGDEGWGDYIIFNVSARGLIENYRGRPVINMADDGERAGHGGVDWEPMP